MDRPVIIARELTKRYAGLEAVRGVSFEVGSGEIVGFLGPNGAGKTTTVRMLSCFLPPTSGTASIHELDVRERPRDVKRLIGVCPQEDNLDPDFHVLKNLLVYGRYFGLPRRVVARALLNAPRVLILDEPTTGLDPQARHAIWTRIRGLRANGTTVLLTTHYMEEASQLCDRVVVMDGGKILLKGTPLELVEREVGRTVVEAWNYGEDFLQFVRALPGRLEEVADRLYFYPHEGDHVERLLDQRFPLQERLIRRATLEDVFLKLTGRALRD